MAKGQIAELSAIGGIVGLSDNGGRKRNAGKEQRKRCSHGRFLCHPARAPGGSATASSLHVGHNLVTAHPQQLQGVSLQIDATIAACGALCA
jgi:hypothetical protein